MQDFLQVVLHGTNSEPVLMIEDLRPGEAQVAGHAVLRRALDDGRVDAAIKAHELAYGWGVWSEFQLAEEAWVPRPGTFVAPGRELDSRPLDDDELSRLWHWLCTVRGSHAQGGPAKHRPEEIVAGLRTALFGIGARGGLLGHAAEWRHWLVTPDFLHASEGEIETVDGGLAYFEALGTNLAWFGLGPRQFVLFLLNAYPMLPSVPEL